MTTGPSDGSSQVREKLLVGPFGSQSDRPVGTLGSEQKLSVGPSGSQSDRLVHSRTVRWALSGQSRNCPSDRPVHSQTVRFTVGLSGGRSRVRAEMSYRTVRLTTGPSDGSTLERTDWLFFLMSPRPKNPNLSKRPSNSMKLGPRDLQDMWNLFQQEFSERSSFHNEFEKGTQNLGHEVRLEKPIDLSCSCYEISGNHS